VRVEPGRRPRQLRAVVRVFDEVGDQLGQSWVLGQCRQLVLGEQLGQPPLQLAALVPRLGPRRAVQPARQLRVPSQQGRHRLGEQGLDHRVVPDDTEARPQEAPSRLEGPRRHAVDADLQRPLLVLGRRRPGLVVAGLARQPLAHRPDGHPARLGDELFFRLDGRLASQQLDHRPAEPPLLQRGSKPRKLRQPRGDPRRLVDPARLPPDALEAVRPD